MQQILLAALITAFAAWGVWSARGLPQHLQLAVYDDSDMKIAPASPSKSQAFRENNEFETKEYLRHRENGNLDRADKLAQDYAGVLYHLMKMHGPGSDGATVRQKAVLFSFVMRELTKDYPIPAVGAKIRQAFDDAVLQRDATLYQIVTDSEPMTLYALCSHDEGAVREMGETFAKLCEREEDAAYIAMGIDCVNRYRQLCGDMLENSGFIL